MILCGSESANTGIGNCPISLNAIDGHLYLPATKRYTEAEVKGGNFYAILAADACNANALERIQPIMGFTSADTDGADRQTSESNYGNRVETRGAIPGWVFTMWQNWCLQKLAHINFNGSFKQWRPILVDIDGSIALAEYVDANGVKTYGGFDLTELYVGIYNPATGTDPDSWTIGFRLRPSQWNRNWAFVDQRDMGGDVHDIQGMSTVNISNISQTPVVTGTYVLSLTQGCGATNLGLLYPTLGAAGANWVATNQIGGVITVTSATHNATTGNTTLVLDTTDTDFEAGEPIRLSLSPAHVTTILGTCYESEQITNLPNA